MTTAKRRRGRPRVRDLPQPIDDTPENVAWAIMARPPKKDWRYEYAAGRGQPPGLANHPYSSLSYASSALPH